MVWFWGIIDGEAADSCSGWGGANLVSSSYCSRKFPCLFVSNSGSLCSFSKASSLLLLLFVPIIMLSLIKVYITSQLSDLHLKLQRVACSFTRLMKVSIVSSISCERE